MNSAIVFFLFEFFQPDSPLGVIVTDDQAYRIVQKNRNHETCLSIVQENRNEGLQIMLDADLFINQLEIKKSKEKAGPGLDPDKKSEIIKLCEREKWLQTVVNVIKVSVGIPVLLFLMNAEADIDRGKPVDFSGLGSFCLILLGLQAAGFAAYGLLRLIHGKEGMELRKKDGIKNIWASIVLTAFLVSWFSLLYGLLTNGLKEDNTFGILVFISISVAFACYVITSRKRLKERLNAEKTKSSPEERDYSGVELFGDDRKSD